MTPSRESSEVVTRAWRRMAASRSSINRAAVLNANISKVGLEVYRGIAGQAKAASSAIIAITQTASSSVKPALFASITEGHFLFRTSLPFLPVGRKDRKTQSHTERRRRGLDKHKDDPKDPLELWRPSGKDRSMKSFVRRAIEPERRVLRRWRDIDRRQGSRDQALRSSFVFES